VFVCQRLNTPLIDVLDFSVTEFYSVLGSCERVLALEQVRLYDLVTSVASACLGGKDEALTNNINSWWDAAGFNPHEKGMSDYFKDHGV
jgi:hypothetical protein